jgi:hypothetical protein
MCRLLPYENIFRLEDELDQEDGLPQVSGCQALPKALLAPRQTYIKIYKQETFRQRD